MANEQDQVTITQVDADGNEAEFDISTASAEDASVAGEIVQALFDGEDANAEVFLADTDGDGKIDAGGTDTDGDGQVDMVVGDTDGDGKIDAASADTDGDGKLDVIVMDTDGDGEIDAMGEDTDGDGQIDTAYFDADGDGEFETVIDAEVDAETDDAATMEGGLPTEEEISTNSIEFTVGEDGFPITETETTEYTETFSDQPTDDSVAQPLFDAPAYGETPASESEPDNSLNTEEADQQIHADAARDAQASADEFVARGDYAAAAEAREVAENEAWAAGDNSMLGASDSQDLENAAYRQEVAEDYRTQQAEHIAEGDYEAAKEDALNAGYAISDADYMAGGSDHTGQADQDAYNLGNAVHDEKNAEYFAGNAEWYAEQGNTDAAQSSMDNAAGYQQSADAYAAQADPVSPVYDVDPSSAVDVGGGYDMSAVDTGFDASAAAPTTFDSGTDDGTV